MWLPYVEPLVLRHGKPMSSDNVPSFAHEVRDDVLGLAKLWDAQSLLHLRRGEVDPQVQSRVFNSYKNPEKDRQIVDRRLVNKSEMHLAGPSAFLPAASLLSALSVPRFTHHCKAFISDRKDFYHQAKVSDARAASNALCFAFQGSELQGTRAFNELWEGEPSHLRPLLLDTSFVPCFKSLYQGYQGDHLGVEYALEAHGCFLEQAGLLAPASRLLGKGPLPFGPTWQALFIDDLVGISVEPRAAPRKGLCEAERLHQIACKAYSKGEVLGSEEKDILGESLFQAIGAEVCSDERAVRTGLVTASAPFSRHLSVATLSLRAASLRVTTPNLIAKLVGSWVSIALFRRAAMVVFSKVFGVSRAAANDSRTSSVARPLPRAVSQELALASVLMPLMSVDLGASFAPALFATDASLSKGAACETAIDPGLSRVLWESCDRLHVHLDSPARALLKCAGDNIEDEGPVSGPGPTTCQPSFVPFLFDLVLIGNVPASFAEACSLKGLVCSPVLNSQISPHFDYTQPAFGAWLDSMIREGRVKGLALFPPVGTFSAAFRPRLRSYKAPLGFRGTLLDSRVKKGRVKKGNLALLRCLLFLSFALKAGLPAVLTVPKASFASRVAPWRSLRGKPGCGEILLNSCCFGASSLRPLRLLVCHFSFGPSAGDCLCKPRLSEGPILGDPSLPLCKGLSLALASAFRGVIDCSSRSPEVPGIESLLANDCLLTRVWSVTLAFRWHSNSHINVLELAALGALVRLIAIRYPDSRVVVLIDSQVAKHSAARGRSTSWALTPGLRRLAALALAFGLQACCAGSCLWSAALFCLCADSFKCSRRPYQELSLAPCLRPGPV